MTYETIKMLMISISVGTRRYTYEFQCYPFYWQVGMWRHPQATWMKFGPFCFVVHYREFVVG